MNCLILELFTSLTSFNLGILRATFEISRLFMAAVSFRMRYYELSMLFSPRNELFNDCGDKDIFKRMKKG